MVSRIIITATAFTLAVLGGAFLFVPDELLHIYGVDASASVIVQQFGIALLGLALANWIVRASAMGGIYGRAIVSADLVYFGATFLLYVGSALEDGSNLMLWSNLIISGVLTVLFALMLFGRIQPKSKHELEGN